MKVIDLSTHLDAPSAKVWEAVKKPSTFEYVTKGLLGFTVEGIPEEELRPGQKMELRLRALNVLPLGKHTINIESVDESARKIQTRESSALIKRWDHTISVEDEGNGTLYRDYVEIDAGINTPAVWAFANALYRYRHRRWISLAKILRG